MDINLVVSDILSEVGDAFDEDADDKNWRDSKSCINALGRYLF